MRQSEAKVQWRVLYLGFFLLLGNVGLAELAAADEPAKRIHQSLEQGTCPWAQPWKLPVLTPRFGSQARSSILIGVTTVLK